MPKLPYFRWYPAEAESDGDWCSFDLAESGLFLRLLNYSWSNNGLPAEPAAVFDALRLPRRVTLDAFLVSWATVGKKFSLCDDGRLHNARQEKERTAAATKSEKSSGAAHLKWIKTHTADVIQTDRVGTADAPAPASTNGYADASANGMHTPDPDAMHGVVVGAMPRASRDAHMTSDSASSSEEKGTQVKFAEFSDWAEEAYARHAKKKHKFESLLKLKDLFAKSLALRALFDHNHKLWCATEDWQKNNGSYVPPLDEWLSDDGWKKPPTTGRIVLRPEPKGIPAGQIE